VAGGQADGQGEDAVNQALKTLLSAGHDLPASAQVCLEDEFLYYTTVPALGSAGLGLATARAYFDDTLGSGDRLVQACLSPCGRTWIAAAVDAAWVEQLRNALDSHDVQLGQLRCALLEDLANTPMEFSGGDGVAVLLRGEGATLVGVRAHGVSEIAWERCDMQLPAVLAARVLGYTMRFAARIGRAAEAAGLDVVIVPAGNRHHDEFSQLAHASGWRMYVPATVQGD
jgi:hypothetical protein